MPTPIVRPVLISIGLLALGALSGCISSHETVYTDVTRVPVTFASERAGRMFYETLSRTPESRRRTEKSVSVELLVIDVERRVVAGNNKLFNEAVAFADTNRDGAISDTEAEVFATAWNLTRS